MRSASSTWAQQYAGASQHRIATATGILQGRVSEILKGNRQETALEVFERNADGLNMPDDARVTLGLAPKHGPRRRGRDLDLFGFQQTTAIEFRGSG
jgi:hypothetical protein